MIQFALIAILLILVVAAFIVPPLWFVRRPPAGAADRQASNLAIFRDQLADLAAERQAGALADADFAQAEREIQRRLLEEVPADAGEADGSSVPSRKLAFVLVLLLPVLSLAAYGILGNPRALDPAQAVAQPQMTPEQINEMVGRLAARMQENPDDLQGWLMLARSYKTMGRYAEAGEAYGKAEKLVNEDPDLLASYAETLAMAGGKGLKGKPRQLVERALKLNPKHAHSLFLAGAAAMEAGDNKQGIAYWEALLPQVDPGSEIDQMLRSGIDKMKAGGKG